MGAIVAYTSDPNEDKARQDGLAVLGQLFISYTKPSVADKAEGLRQALYEAKYNRMLDLRFQSNSIGVATPRGYKISVPPKKSVNIIECPLTNDAGDSVGKLRLTQIPDKDKEDDGSGNPKNDKYQMHVVFPENADDKGNAYIQTTARDALAIGSPGGDITKITNYLAAFKFLSRCK